MLEPYLAPTECARLSSGPNPVLPFLPKSTSTSSHQGHLQQTGPFKRNISSTSLRDPRVAALARGDKEWTRKRTTALPLLNSSQREIKCISSSVQKAVSNSTYNKETLT